MNANETMRYMGLDVGEKTIGVSISDALGWTAQGKEVIRRRPGHPERDFLRLQQLITEYGVEKVIVGYPRNMDGSYGQSADRCKQFAQQFGAYSGVAFQLWDERLTTQMAERTLISADMNRKRRKQVVDKLAAVMILQNYLDALNKEADNDGDR